MWFLFLLLTGLAGCSVIVFLVLTIMKKNKAWIGLLVSFGVSVFTGIAFIISVFLAVPSGIGSTSPVVYDAEDTPNVIEGEDKADNNKKNVEEPVTDKTVEVDEEFVYNDLIIRIDEIDITEKDVKIGLTLINDSDATKSFYPDQNDILIGKKQLSANMFMTKGDVSGDIHAGVEKTGTLRFIADDDGIDVGEIVEIKLMFGDVYDTDTYSNTEYFEEVINVK